MSSCDAAKRLLQLRWSGVKFVGESMMDKLKREVREPEVRFESVQQSAGRLVTT